MFLMNPYSGRWDGTQRMDAVFATYAGINLSGYHPPGHPGAFAPKCVPSPRAFAQRNGAGRLHQLAFKHENGNTVIWA